MSELQQEDVPLELVVIGASKDGNRVTTYTALVTNHAEIDRHYWLVTTPDEGDVTTEEGTLEPGANAEHQISLEFPRSCALSLQFTHSGDRVQASAMLLGPLV